jgi:hypothetical protein
VMKEPVVVAPKFRSFLSITDPNGVCGLMDCAVTVFVDEFGFFPTFSVVLRVLGRPERLSSSTDTRPVPFKNCCPA